MSRKRARRRQGPIDSDINQTNEIILFVGGSRKREIIVTEKSGEVMKGGDEIVTEKIGQEKEIVRIVTEKSGNEVEATRIERKETSLDKNVPEKSGMRGRDSKRRDQGLSVFLLMGMTKRTGCPQGKEKERASLPLLGMRKRGEKERRKEKGKPRKTRTGILEERILLPRTRGQIGERGADQREGKRVRREHPGRGRGLSLRVPLARRRQT